MLTIHIITIFPDIFKEIFSTSIIKRAVDKKLLTINIHDLRNWTKDNHKTVDMHPYGGGAGMVIMFEPIYQAIDEIDPEHKCHRILTSPRGNEYTQEHAQELTKKQNLLIICGHYEGVDQRVTDYLIDEELSIGKYVLSGGEIPAMVIVDSTTRLIKNSLGNEDSLKEETFNTQNYMEYDQYTRPEKFITKEGKELNVPQVLVSGNHKEIKEWRKANSKGKLI